MQLESRKVNSLRPWSRNPRSVREQDMVRLKKQITDLGMYKPLLITEDGEVLGGNMRLTALNELGVEDVMCSVVSADTLERKLQYALSENDRIGVYDDDAMAELLVDVPTFPVDDYKIDVKFPMELAAIVEVASGYAPPTADEQQKKDALRQAFKEAGHAGKTCATHDQEMTYCAGCIEDALSRATNKLD